jgi:glycosyltransferase involved in cell wall biosynthesis
VLSRPRLTRIARRPFERFPLLKRFQRRAFNVLLADGVAPAPDGFWTEREQYVYARLKSALAKRASGVTTREPVFAADTESRPRLAFVSPLPPERTGIADYSADLLPALSRYYDIVLITDQKKVDAATVGIDCPVHDPAWLRANCAMIDRVIYQMGNSHFHDYMRDLMVEIPGTVVLHDVFLSGLFSWLEKIDTSGGVWTRTLYQSHGYAAMRDRFRDEEAAKIRYPVNLGVVQAAQGVIVHSEYARGLASQWLGPDFTEHWKVIPHLRALAEPGPRAAARQAIGLPQDAFVLCSFGNVEPRKLNRRLLNAFFGSSLVRDAKCLLVFVGENHPGDYGTELLDVISANKLEARVGITGWMNGARFREYLIAADVAVQLRTGSRGETSGALLDCLNAGMPVIANAHGSAAEFPAHAVWMLDDNFSEADLITALETLHEDAGRRDDLRRRARELVATRHAPEICARLYAKAIEAFYAEGTTGLSALLDAAAAISPPPSEPECRILSRAIARSLPTKRPSRQLLLDVSATCRAELKTGIERVARGLTLAFLDKPPERFRVEPVYLSDEGGSWHYRYARRFTLGLLGCPPDILADAAVELQAGDIVLGLDHSGRQLIEAKAAGLIADCRDRSVSVYFTVHDLLPLRLPRFFPPGDDVAYEKWLHAVLQTDGALCISRTVADDLHDWAENRDFSPSRPFHIGHFRPGSDITNAAATRGFPPDAPDNLEAFAARPSFLMVGTIEPRKGHLPVLDAFDRLWGEGVDVNLIVVGAEGWRDLPRDIRRTIPQIVTRLQSHHESGKRLFWLNGSSDEYLEKIYAASSCLIAAAEAEGFGLPLIEAARHGLPIMARDIPVFREVAGEYAFYFTAEKPDLAQAIKDWLQLNRTGQHPKSDAIAKTAWAHSAERVMDILLRSDCYASVAPKSQRGDERILREALVREQFPATGFG